jgi:uncharacterized membrane protein (DUF373 family)
VSDLPRLPRDTPPAAAAGARKHALAGVALLEDLAHFLVLAVLLGVAGLVLAHTLTELLHPDREFAVRVTAAINGVLFVIIVMELLRTVVSHFDHAGFQLRPFLIIGTISAVRHILTIGARVTLQGEATGEAFNRTQIELGVEAGVVLALAIALLLVRDVGSGQS